MGTYLINSRLPANVRYVRQGGKQGSKGGSVAHSVLILGRSGNNPFARTTVSAEDYDWLKHEASFRQHVQSGHLTVHPAEPVAATPVIHQPQVAKVVAAKQSEGPVPPVAPPQEEKAKDEPSVPGNAEKAAESAKPANGKKSK
jgi:hypothetical protein